MSVFSHMNVINTEIDLATHNMQLSSLGVHDNLHTDRDRDALENDGYLIMLEVIDSKWLEQCPCLHGGTLNHSGIRRRVLHGFLQHVSTPSNLINASIGVS